MSRDKIILIISAIIAGLIGVLSVINGQSGTSAVSDSAKLDQSREVKSNVGDKTIGGSNTQLEDISVGGDFNLDQSTKK